MARKYKISLTVITIMILFTMTVGTSYSFFTVTVSQTDTNDIATACLDIGFSDSDVITLNADGSYAYPMSEASALSKLTPYTFTITNNCGSSATIKYAVVLNTLTTTSYASGDLTDYVRYKLDSNSSAMLKNATDYTSSLPDSVITANNISKSYLLGSDTTGITLTAGESKTFTLYLWIDEDTGNDVMGYNFEGQLMVYTYM